MIHCECVCLISVAIIIFSPGILSINHMVYQAFLPSSSPQWRDCVAVAVLIQTSMSEENEKAVFEIVGVRC